jgi:hypothetical protein
MLGVRLAYRVSELPGLLGVSAETVRRWRGKARQVGLDLGERAPGAGEVGGFLRVRLAARGCLRLGLEGAGRAAGSRTDDGPGGVVSVIMPIPLAFWAEDQADAERQALDWAAAEGRIVEARVVEATRALGTKRWTVTLECSFRGVAKQTTLDLGL